MSSKTSVDTIWHIPDDLWSLIAPLLGPEKQPGTRGRKPTPFRLVFDAIVYVLRIGCQWQALPRAEYAPASTIHGVYRKWALFLAGMGCQIDDPNPNDLLPSDPPDYESQFAKMWSSLRE